MDVYVHHRLSYVHALNTCFYGFLSFLNTIKHQQLELAKKIQYFFSFFKVITLLVTSRNKKVNFVQTNY